jgi:CheY-like chemotaxis protein
MIGGVLSAFKAFRMKRGASKAGPESAATPPQAEVTPTEVDRAPAPVERNEDRPAEPAAFKAPIRIPIPVAAPAPVAKLVETPPAAPIPDPTLPVAPAKAGMLEQLGLQILVAEDNPINRKVMQLLLRRMGYEADIAIDGQQAVEMAIAKPYDAILMDLHMPRMGGIEATEAIVARLEPPPRVVAVTADVTQQARAECKRVGMAAYLTKPVDSNLLLRELKEVEALRAAAFGRTG